MTTYQHILQALTITALSLCVLFFGFVGTAFAQEIDVDYGGGPLFSNADFLPGDTEVRTFTVENLSETQQEVRLRTVNESNTGLAEVVHMQIEAQAGAEYFDDTLLQLFAVNFVSLGNIDVGDTEQFVIGATFLPDSGNGYQSGSAGFALCVGFAGDNENCVTDTDPGPGGYAQGSYDGGNGNGESISLTPSNDSDDDDDLPPGQIAGESTTTPPTFFDDIGTAVAQPFIDFVRGAVLGDTASATTSSSTEVEIEEGTDEEDESVVDAVLGSIDDLGDSGCTLLWLALLVAISVSWSLIEDILGKARAQFGRFFVRNIVFGGIYLALLVLSSALGFLDTIWWLFALAWAIFTGFDYYLHNLALDLWSPQMRNIYFFVTSLVIALLGYFTPLLCVWIPFVGIMLVSAILYAVDR